MSVVEITEVRHDARCPSWRVVELPCTCRDPHGYTPEPAPAVDLTCPVCEQPADWAVGDEDRACTAHVGAVLAFVYATSDGFAPILVLPIEGVR